MNPDELDQGPGEDDNEELDFSKTKLQKFVFPDGDYEMVCVEVVKDISSNGNKMLVWSWRGGEELNNGKFKQFMAQTEGGMWRILATCEALDLAKEGEKIKVSDILANAPGRRATVTLKKERRDGKDRSNISNVSRHKNGPGTGREAEFPPV